MLDHEFTLLTIFQHLQEGTDSSHSICNFVVGPRNLLKLNAREMLFEGFYHMKTRKHLVIFGLVLIIYLLNDKLGISIDLRDSNLPLNSQVESNNETFILCDVVCACKGYLVGLGHIVILRADQ